MASPPAPFLSTSATHGGDADLAAAAWVPLVASFASAANTDPRALWSAFSMILVSEIGDKTFLIAAILAMRNSRSVVFAGAFSALALMSVLSAFLGAAFPSLLPKALTTLLAALLFLAFGVRMLKEAQEMTGEEMGEEWLEAEREIEQETNEEGLKMHDMESGHAGNDDGAHVDAAPAPTSYPSAAPERPRTPKPKADSFDVREGARNLCGLCFSPVFAQAFVLTFLGEWGDRSQIATIALAAAHSVALISIGTIAGHCICTGVAVYAGRSLASRISVKKVTLGGACLFLLFGVLYLLEALHEARGGGEAVNPTAALGAFKQLPTTLSSASAAAGGGGAVAAPSAPGVAAAVAATMGAPAAPTQPELPKMDEGLKEVLEKAKDAGAHVMRRAGWLVG